MSVFVAITARSPPLSPLYRSSAPRVLMNPEAWAQEQAENIAKQMAPTIARAPHGRERPHCAKGGRGDGREGAPEA